MTTALIVLVALALDALLGETRRFHPLVGFGQLAKYLEKMIYGDSYIQGVIAVIVLLVPFTLLAATTQYLAWGDIISALLLYLAIGWKSLDQHAAHVRDALVAGDLPTARQRVGYMVSRDTSALDEQGAAKATVESVLENGNDAIFGAIFWFVVASAPGVVLFRLSNTLDAMWGYRNERYLHFGWAAARLDDLLNFVPARLTALSYAMTGNVKQSLRCWRHQGNGWKSPNAGPVMAAGAGSINVSLGGTATYHGKPQVRPPLGQGESPSTKHIDLALGLIRRSLLLWVLVLFFGGWIIDYVATY
ncbi:adenosylcobinamide-phosphate synthase CbiB [Pseudomonadota bacterium]